MSEVDVDSIEQLDDNDLIDLLEDITEKTNSSITYNIELKHKGFILDNVVSKDSPILYERKIENVEDVMSGIDVISLKYLEIP